MSLLNLKTRLSKLSCGGLLFILTLVFSLLPPAETEANPTATITIKGRVEINTAEVILGQIATIEGADARFNQRLKDIPITKAPLPGDTHQIDLDLLQKRLQQHQIDLAAVIVEAPPQVIITRSHVEIHKEDIEKIVSEFITQQVPQQNKTLRIKEMQIPASVILPEGRITYKVTAPRNRQLMGRCPLSVHFSVNGNTEKKVWVTAVLELLGPVVVTRKPLGRYKPIAADDIEVQTMDLANLPANVLSDPEAAIGKRTKRAIGAQMPLRADSIELPPLVKRGDFVTIIAESQNLKVTTLGQVKKKGCLGERIPVVNLDSKKVLQALVVDANTVKVDF
ncbi:MAG: flagellar basal body P-ring formation protein FlgA [Deltaproteobacteria bacterium]|jgi:flagella basal body P-ring formation protein FlgA|nr:flagellar basal body P-ring formation protein FlgA [Deltaproteobacteria bacterium]